MRFVRTVLVLASLFALPSLAAQPEDKPWQGFQWADQDRGVQPEFLRVPAGNDVLTISYLGKVLIGDKDVFAIPVRERGSILRIQWVKTANGLLLFLYVEEGGEWAETQIVHLRSSPWRVDWTTTLPEPADEPLLADGYIYVGGWGFVSKVGVKTGKFAWVHRDLYRPPEIFRTFQRPARTRGTVVFTPVYRTKPVPTDWPRELVVEDQSGRILSAAR